MKLLFNGLNSGYANNGGSRTVFKSASILRKLGHEVYTAARADNCTLFEHTPIIKHIPNVDVIINNAAVDYLITKQTNIKKKYAWWRANENWSVSEETLKYYYRDTDVHNLVNSKGLQKLLKSYGAESDVIYQGIDDHWIDLNIRPKNKIRIGCIYTGQARKRWKDFVKLANILGNDRYEYACIGSKRPKEKFLTNIIINGNEKQLINFYSSCHVFFWPSINEGLCNVGIESALCGCLLVCSDHFLNGMVCDYADDTTAMIYQYGNLNEAAYMIKNADYSKVSKCQEAVYTKIGTREYNMKKLIELISK